MLPSLRATLCAREELHDRKKLHGRAAKGPSNERQYTLVPLFGFKRSRPIWPKPSGSNHFSPRPPPDPEATGRTKREEASYGLGSHHRPGATARRARTCKGARLVRNEVSFGDIAAAAALSGQRLRGFTGTLGSFLFPPCRRPQLRVCKFRSEKFSGRRLTAEQPGLCLKGCTGYWELSVSYLPSAAVFRARSSAATFLGSAKQPSLRLNGCTGVIGN